MKKKLYEECYKHPIQEGQIEVPRVTLCFFLPTGKTFTFKGVNILCDNENVLEFSYKAVSDGKMKKGCFQKSQICGWSLYPNVFE